MAENKASLVIETVANNDDLKSYSEGMADLRQEIKRATAELKEKEKAEIKDEAAIKAQAAEITQLKAQYQALNSQMKNTVRGLQDTAKQATDTTSAFSSLKTSISSAIEKKTGINIGDIASKFSSVNVAIGATATAVIAAGAALAKAGAEVSKYTNQFITFAGSAKGAAEMYDKFSAVARDMNSEWNEEQVYNLAKEFMRVGKSADESAGLIRLCADAAAKTGTGVQGAEQLADMFVKLSNNVKLTDRDYKALAAAGIDLTDVQDEMRAGGERAYQALYDKLQVYKGGMAETKQTGAEMQADVSANFTELGRQIALLVDDIFGISKAFKAFCSWIIDVSNTVIEGIKRMRNVLNSGVDDAYSKALDEWEEIYGDTFEGDDNARLTAKMAYANATADVVVEAEKRKQEAIEETTAAAKKQVQAITAEPPGNRGGGGGGRTARAVNNLSEKQAERELERQKKDLQRETQQIAKETTKSAEELAKVKLATLKTEQQIALVGLEGKELADTQHQQAIDNINAEIQAIKELSDAEQEKIQKEIDVAQAAIDNGTAIDGTQAKIDALREQKRAVEELAAAQVAGKNAEIDLENKNHNENQKGVEGGGISSAFKNLETWGTKVGYLGKQLGTTAANGFADMFSSIIDGSKSAGEAMADFAKTMITNALSMLTQWLAIFAVISIFDPVNAGKAATKAVFGEFSKGGLVNGYATGGKVFGAGTSTSDSIPAMLSAGEYVLSAKTVQKMGGPSVLDELNFGSMQPNLGSVSYNINAVDARSFTGFLKRGGGQALAQYTLNNQRGFSTGGAW